MKHFLVSFFCMSFILIGCSDVPTTPDGSTIMPLTVGNSWVGKWTYYSGDGSVIETLFDTLTITGTVKDNGVTWYEANNGELLANDRKGLHYNDFTPQCILYPVRALYPATASDTFNSAPPTTVLVPEATGSAETINVIACNIVLTTDSTVTVPAGTFTTYVYKPDVLAPNPAQSEDLQFINETIEYYTPNVGPIMREFYERNALVKRWELVNVVLQ